VTRAATGGGQRLACGPYTAATSLLPFGFLCFPLCSLTPRRGLQRTACLPPRARCHRLTGGACEKCGATRGLPHFCLTGKLAAVDGFCDAQWWAGSSRSVRSASDIVVMHVAL
jgi:hypothetical protein